MNIDHLREFIYLAETLSFATTARHFFIGPSVLSKHIAAMEDTLQTKLFERDSRKVSLTDDGKAFYDDIVSVVVGYDRAIANLAARHKNVDLRLRVGYLRGAARPFLPRFVSFMRKEHPEVELDLRCMEYGALTHAHRSRALDIIFTMDFDPEASEICDSEPIYRDRLYAVVSKKHPLAKSTGVTIDQFAGRRLLLPDEKSYPGMSQAYERILRNACETAQIRRYRDVDTFFFRVAHDGAIGLSSGHNYRPQEGRVVFLPVLDADTSFTVSAQWMKDADERIARLGREVAEVCAEHMQGWTDGVSA